MPGFASSIEQSSQCREVGCEAMGKKKKKFLGSKIKQMNADMCARFDGEGGMARRHVSAGSYLCERLVLKSAHALERLGHSFY